MLTSVDDLHVCLEVVECPNNLQPKKVIIPMTEISALTQQIQFQHEEKPPDPFGRSLPNTQSQIFPLPPSSSHHYHIQYHTPSTNKVYRSSQIQRFEFSKRAFYIAMQLKKSSTHAESILHFIVFCVGESKAPPVLYSSYRTVFE